MHQMRAVWVFDDEEHEQKIKDDLINMLAEFALEKLSDKEIDVMLKLIEE